MLYISSRPLPHVKGTQCVTRFDIFQRKTHIWILSETTQFVDGTINSLFTKLMKAGQGLWPSRVTATLGDC